VLTEQDRAEITDLVNLHGHLTDDGELDRFDELFTPDAVYDVAALGYGALHGPAAIRAAALALGDANPVGHHVTNIVITPLTTDSARVRSKGIGIRADGRTGSVVYDDTVTREPEGWRIRYRKTTQRRAALGRDTPGPREVLERFRQTAIDQSVDALREVLAVDVVMEFPFNRPGVPARMAGRDEIVRWTAEMWRTGRFRYEGYRTIAIHDTGDPATIVVEQEAVGTSEAAGTFTLPNLMVLTARSGQIAHVRDYVNVLAAAEALGRKLSI
jgi:ketosteroid isomerase-like protein